ncbi:MAG: response regulator transcription factor [Mycobacteriales bacterium]
MPPAPARILLVEDDAPIRQALEAVLRAEGYEVEAQPDGSRAERVASSFCPDLALLDVRLQPGPDGFTVCRQLRRSRDLPVIFLTAAESIDDRLEGFRVGGDDYLVKPYEARELLARVEALLRRSGLPGSAVLTVGAVTIDPRAEAVAVDGEPVELTRIEFDLLLALAQRRGQVMSKVQLLTRVWGFDRIDTNLVEVHVSSLRRKLEAVGPRVVHTARGIGYVLRG